MGEFPEPVKYSNSKRSSEVTQVYDGFGMKSQLQSTGSNYPPDLVSSLSLQLPAYENKHSPLPFCLSYVDSSGYPSFVLCGFLCHTTCLVHICFALPTLKPVSIDVMYFFFPYVYTSWFSIRSKGCPSGYVCGICL